MSARKRTRRAHPQQQDPTSAPLTGPAGHFPGEVVKVDRGFPLVRLDDGRQVRCQHATALVKNADVRAVVGDRVEAVIPEGADMAQIDRILPRRFTLVRRDPAERTLPQTLAANFDAVIVAQPLAALNLHRLERELVLAFETGAQVLVVLTKADLAESEDQVRAVRAAVDAIAGSAVQVLVVSEDDPASVEAVRAAIGQRTAVLMGRSGVGKSSLVNLLGGPCGAIHQCRPQQRRPREAHDGIARDRRSAGRRACDRHARRTRVGPVGCGCGYRRGVCGHRGPGAGLPLPGLPPCRRARLRGAASGGAGCARSGAPGGVSRIGGGEREGA